MLPHDVQEVAKRVEDMTRHHTKYVERSSGLLGLPGLTPRDGQLIINFYICSEWLVLS